MFSQWDPRAVWDRHLWSEMLRLLFWNGQRSLRTFVLHITHSSHNHPGWPLKPAQTYLSMLSLTELFIVHCNDHVVCSVCVCIVYVAWGLHYILPLFPSEAQMLSPVSLWRFTLHYVSLWGCFPSVPSQSTQMLVVHPKRPEPAY